MFRKVEGFEEKLCRLFLHLVFPSSIIEPIIMIIPNWNNGDGFRQSRIVWLDIKVAVFFLHYLRVIGVCVNIITHE